MQGPGKAGRNRPIPKRSGRIGKPRQGSRKRTAASKTALSSGFTRLEEQCRIFGVGLPRTRQQALEGGIATEAQLIPVKPLSDFSATAKPSIIQAFFERLFGKSEPPWPEKVTINVEGVGKFELDSSIFPEVPDEAKAQFLKDIGDKIQRGHLLVKGLQEGEIDPSQNNKISAPKNAVSDILWYMQARAEQKAGSFTSGTTFLEDPDGRVLAFIDTVAEGYERISSHMGEFQKLDVQRGLDFDNGSHLNLNELLPHGKHTLLYFPLPKRGESDPEVSKMPTNMIFLKMEEHGAAAYKAKGPNRKGGPQSRAVGMSDFLKALGHGWGYIKSKYRSLSGKTEGAKKRRERVPPKLVKEYKAIAKELRDEGLDRFAGILEEGNPTKHGIRFMLARLQEASVATRTGTTVMSESVGKLLALERRLSADYDHLDLRVGEEVIITADELTAS